MEIKLVVLDDDKDDLSLMETYLTRFGYKAKYYSEVDEFEKSLDAMPTIIVTDYYLGGRTGVDMMRKVKDKHPICTFIIVSSQMSVTQLIDIVNVGWGCYYINKGNGDVDKFIK